MKKMIPSGYYHNSIFRTLFILLIVCLVGLVYNGLRKNPLPLLYRQINLNPDTHLTLAQTYLFYRQGNTIFIDTRYQDEYNTGHIRSAINLPARASRDEIMTFIEVIEKEENVVIYCGNIKCNSARRLAGFMKQIGYHNVYVFLDGFDAWLENDLPVNKTNSQ
jgi:rhodanese-related sulfurtransferase